MEQMRRMAGKFEHLKRSDDDAGRILEASLIERERENEIKMQVLEKLARETAFAAGMLECILKINDNHCQDIWKLKNLNSNQVRHGGNSHE